MKKLILSLLCFSLFACGNNSPADFGYKSSARESMPMAMGEPTSDWAEETETASYDEYDQGGQGQSRVEVPAAQRKIIRTANFRMQVDNVEKSTATIEVLIKQKGGFISSVNMSSSGSYINNNLSIRIPNEKLDSLLDLIAKEAIHIDYKRITADDVTAEFVDIQIRLKTKKQVRDRLCRGK